jgi:hypothetical protein
MMDTTRHELYDEEKQVMLSYNRESKHALVKGVSIQPVSSSPWVKLQSAESDYRIQVRFLSRDS